MDRLQKVGAVTAVHSSQVGTSPFGLGFEKLDRAVFDPEKAYDKVAALGVKWIRIQSGWARTEQKKGIYDFTWLDSVVDNLLRRGLMPWLCLCYGNGIYDGDAAKAFGAVGYPPVRNEEQKQAWHRYVTETVRRYKGRIAWFEVWNEPDWCWKHGVSGTEYGEFVKATAKAVHEGNPDAKVIGGSFCSNKWEWLHEVFETGAGMEMDAFTYHGYTPDELVGAGTRIQTIRAFCHAYNPKIRLIQGETGAQSRRSSAGALSGAAWTQEKQAKFLARHMLAHLFQGVEFTSYFSCLDMIEALGGRVGDKASYLDYAYFGVLSADFDEDGVATGEYEPKLSYRTLQTLAAIFREEFSIQDLPVDFIPSYSPSVLREDDKGAGLLFKGFRRPGGSSAFVYWKPSELLTTSYESTVSLKLALVSGECRLIDLLNGSVYKLPDDMIEKSGGCFLFHHLPLRDYPLLLTFGDFAGTSEKE